MDVTKLKQVHVFLLAVFHLALHADVVFCNPSFVSSEGVNHSNSKAKTESTCSAKYLSELYFEKHDSLLDSYFASYIANDLPIGLCGTLQEKLDTQLSVDHRHLIGEGSHRKLHTSIDINIQPGLIAQKSSHLLKFVIVEKLPSGIFADPFELQHLITRGVLTDAIVTGDTNLELPSVASDRSLVEVHVDIKQEMPPTYDDGLKIEIELPLHTRYPPLGESGYFTVEFGSPDLFLLDDIEEMSPNNRSCLLARKIDAKSQTVVWKVPTGIKEHSEIVSMVTFASAVVSTFFIVFTTLYYPRSVGK